MEPTDNTKGHTNEHGKGRFISLHPYIKIISPEDFLRGDYFPEVPEPVEGIEQDIDHELTTLREQMQFQEQDKDALER